MSKIPRNFHFVFGLKPQVEPFHLVYYLCLESCLQVNRPERVFFYYYYMPYGEWWERIRNRVELVKVSLEKQIKPEAYQDELTASFRYAHHADFIRLEKLHELGGVYADIDTLFLHPIPAHLYEQSCVLGREDRVLNTRTKECEDSLCNALIMAKRGSAFISRWLKKMPAAFDGSWSNHSCLLANRLSQQYPREIHVEAPQSFYPYMWNETGLRALLLESHGRWEGAYSVHLWNHLWWSRHRLDFCTFSGERLTERFIRKGGNTYALAARRFLPPPNERVRWKRVVCWMRDLFREYWSRRYEVRVRVRKKLGLG